jgi:hypothetical protein
MQEARDWFTCVHACRWAILVHPWLEKMPLNGLTCIAWILQGPLDVTNELNWCGAALPLTLLSFRNSARLLLMSS